MKGLVFFENCILVWVLTVVEFVRINNYLHCNLGSFWYRVSTKHQKFIKNYIWSVLLYGCETWTLNIYEIEREEALETEHKKRSSL